MSGVSGVVLPPLEPPLASAEDEPSILGIVDEHVSVALICSDNLVSAHFPGINGIHLAPFKKNVNALEYRRNARAVRVSYVHIKTNSRNVTLYVIKRLKVGAVICTALLAAGSTGGGFTA